MSAERLLASPVELGFCNGSGVGSGLGLGGNSKRKGRLMGRQVELHVYYPVDAMRPLAGRCRESLAALA